MALVCRKESTVRNTAVTGRKERLTVRVFLILRMVTAIAEIFKEIKLMGSVSTRTQAGVGMKETGKRTCDTEMARRKMKTAGTTTENGSKT